MFIVIQQVSLILPSAVTCTVHSGHDRFLVLLRSGLPVLLFYLDINHDNHDNSNNLIKDFCSDNALIWDPLCAIFALRVGPCG